MHVSITVTSDDKDILTEPPSKYVVTADISGLKLLEAYEVQGRLARFVGELAIEMGIKYHE